MQPRQVEGLLLDVYSCPPDRARWSHVLDRICREMRARSAVIQLLVTDGERASARWIARDSASEAASREHDRYMGDEVNPRLRVQPISNLREDKSILRDRDLFAPGDPALVEVRDRLAAIQLGHYMGANTPLPDNSRLALVLHRDLRDRHEFDADAEHFALALLPHLRQAIQLSEEIDGARQRACDLEDAIDQVRCGLVLCDADGRVCWANRPAHRLLARNGGIRISGERLVCASATDATQLKQRITQVAQEGGRFPATDRYLVFGRHTLGELQVLIHPVAGQPASAAAEALPQARVLLVLSAPGQAPALAPEIIAQVFALSPAESRVAAALCNGLTLDEYASAQGVTIGTARFQLKQVLAKTGASRQADLVRQIFSSVIAQHRAD